MNILLPLLFSLILAAPAYADYSGSASFDWSSLTITGVPFTLEEHGQQQSTTLMNWTGLNAQVPGDPLDTRSITPNPQSINDGFAQQPWIQQTVNTSLANVGTASALSSADTLSASLFTHSADVGSLQATIERNGILTPTQTGNLTISIHYTLAQLGVPQTSGVLPEFVGMGHVQLTAGLDGVQHAQLFAQPGDHTQSGVLSLTESVVRGTAMFFGFFAETNVNQPLVGGGGGGRLPLPDLFWPTLVVMVGFVSFVVWRRRRYE